MAPQTRIANTIPGSSLTISSTMFCLILCASRGAVSGLIRAKVACVNNKSRAFSAQRANTCRLNPTSGAPLRHGDTPRLSCGKRSWLWLGGMIQKDFLSDGTNKTTRRLHPPQIQEYNNVNSLHRWDIQESYCSSPQYTHSPSMHDCHTVLTQQWVRPGWAGLKGRVQTLCGKTGGRRVTMRPHLCRDHTGGLLGQAPKTGWHWGRHTTPWKEHTWWLSMQLQVQVVKVSLIVQENSHYTLKLWNLQHITQVLFLIITNYFLIIKDHHIRSASCWVQLLLPWWWWRQHHQH